MQQSLWNGSGTPLGIFELKVPGVEYGKAAVPSPCGEGVKERTRECQHPRKNCPTQNGDLNPLHDFVPCSIPCEGTK